MPAIGRILSGGLLNLFPMSMHPKWDWRVLDTFDWYSPKYQYKLTYAEVIDWYVELGFKHVERLQYPVAVKGKL